MSMKQILVIMAAVVLVGCEENREAKDKKLTKAEAYAELLAEAKKARRPRHARMQLLTPLPTPLLRRRFVRCLRSPKADSLRRIWEKVTFLNLERLPTYRQRAGEAYTVSQRQPTDRSKEARSLRS